MESLHDILKNRREQLGLSLREAAELIKLSHSYLNRLEKGYDPRTGLLIKPSPNVLKLISEAYKLEYKDLLRITGYLESNKKTKENPVRNEKTQINEGLSPYRILSKEEVKELEETIKANLEVFFVSSSISNINKEIMFRHINRLYWRYKEEELREIT